MKTGNHNKEGNSLSAIDQPEKSTCGEPLLANLSFFLYYSKNTAKSLVFFAPESWRGLLKKNFKITHIFMKLKIDDKYLDPK